MEKRLLELQYREKVCKVRFDSFIFRLQRELRQQYCRGSFFLPDLSDPADRSDFLKKTLFFKDFAPEKPFSGIILNIFLKRDFIFLKKGLLLS